MLTFGATWCGDCRAQLTQLGEMRVVAMRASSCSP